MRFLLVLPLLVPGAAPVAAPVADRVVNAVHAGHAPVTASPTELAAGLEVLRRWDLRRARAWAAVDEDALLSLYVPGSAAAAADLRLLRAYAARRLVVRRLVTQVFAVRVLRLGETTLRLRVFDRVAGGVISHRGQVTRLRSSPPKTRVVELSRVGRTWRVAAVRPVSGSEPAPRAARR